MANIRCSTWFPNKKQPGNILRFSKRRLRAKKLNRKDILDVEDLLHVISAYGQSEKVTLSDAQKAALLVSMKCQGDDDDRHSAGSGEI